MLPALLLVGPWFAGAGNAPWVITGHAGSREPERSHTHVLSSQENTWYFPERKEHGPGEAGSHMTFHEVQDTLDDVRRRSAQARAEHVRHGLSWPYLLAEALLVFTAFASYDLPNPWGGAVLLPSLLLAMGTIAVYLRKAPVRMPLTYKGALLGAAAGLVLVGLFRLLSDVAGAVGVPAPHVVAAAALCVAGVLAAHRWGTVVVARELRGHDGSRRR
ncbi:hypothetical protein GCM10020227_05470 [Streptomyces flavovirens]